MQQRDAHRNKCLPRIEFALRCIHGNLNLKMFLLVLCKNTLKILTLWVRQAKLHTKREVGWFLLLKLKIQIYNK